MEIKAGYCYQKLLDELSEEGFSVQHIKNKLGPYPKINTLICEIFRVTCKDVLLRQPVWVMPGLLHVEDNGQDTWLSTWIYDWKTRVGGDAEGESPINFTNYEQEKLNILQNEFQVYDLNGVNKIADQTLKKVATDILVAKTIAQMEPGHKGTRLPCAVEPDRYSAEDMRRAYPEQELIFSSSKSHGHPTARNLHVCEDAQLDTLLDYNNNNVVSATINGVLYDDYYGEVGPHFVSLFTKQKANVHGCCNAVYTIEDGVRHTQGLVRLNDLVQSGTIPGAAVDLAYAGENQFCRKPAEKCFRTCMKLKFHKSTLDMSLKTQAKIMAQKKCLVAYETIPYLPEAFDASRAQYIRPDDDYCFVRSDKTGRTDPKGSYLRMKVFGESSKEYVHSVANYLEKFTTTVMSYNDSFYHREFLYEKCGTAFFSITLISASVATTLKNTFVNSALPCFHNKSTIFMKVNAPRDVNTMYKDIDKLLVTRFVRVDKSVDTNYTNFLMTKDPNVYQLTNCLSFLRSLNSRRTINGVDIQGVRNTMTDEDLLYYGTHKYLFMYRVRLINMEYVKRVMTDTKELINHEKTPAAFSFLDKIVEFFNFKKWDFVTYAHYILESGDEDLTVSIQNIVEKLHVTGIKDPLFNRYVITSHDFELQSCVEKILKPANRHVKNVANAMKIHKNNISVIPSVAMMKTVAAMPVVEMDGKQMLCGFNTLAYSVGLPDKQGEVILDFLRDIVEFKPHLLKVYGDYALSNITDGLNNEHICNLETINFFFAILRVRFVVFVNAKKPLMMGNIRSETLNNTFVVNFVAPKNFCDRKSIGHYNVRENKEFEFDRAIQKFMKIVYELAFNHEGRMRKRLRTIKAEHFDTVTEFRNIMNLYDYVDTRAMIIDEILKVTGYKPSQVTEIGAGTGSVGNLIENKYKVNYTGYDFDTFKSNKIKFIDVSDVNAKAFTMSKGLFIYSVSDGHYKSGFATTKEITLQFLRKQTLTCPVIIRIVDNFDSSYLTELRSIFKKSVVYNAVTKNPTSSEAYLLANFKKMPESSSVGDKMVSMFVSKSYLPALVKLYSEGAGYEETFEKLFAYLKIHSEGLSSEDALMNNKMGLIRMCSILGYKQMRKLWKKLAKEKPVIIEHIMNFYHKGTSALKDDLNKIRLKKIVFGKDYKENTDVVDFSGVLVFLLRMISIFTPWSVSVTYAQAYTRFGIQSWRKYVSFLSDEIPYMDFSEVSLDDVEEHNDFVLRMKQIYDPNKRHTINLASYNGNKKVRNYLVDTVTEFANAATSDEDSTDEATDSSASGSETDSYVLPAARRPTGPGCKKKRKPQGRKPSDTSSDDEPAPEKPRPERPKPTPKTSEDDSESSLSKSDSSSISSISDLEPDPVVKPDAKSESTPQSDIKPEFVPGKIETKPSSDVKLEDVPENIVHETDLRTEANILFNKPQVDPDKPIIIDPPVQPGIVNEPLPATTDAVEPGQELTEEIPIKTPEEPPKIEKKRIHKQDSIVEHQDVSVGLSDYTQHFVSQSGVFITNTKLSKGMPVPPNITIHNLKTFLESKIAKDNIIPVCVYLNSQYFGVSLSHYYKKLPKKIHNTPMFYDINVQVSPALHQINTIDKKPESTTAFDDDSMVVSSMNRYRGREITDINDRTASLKCALYEFVQNNVNTHTHNSTFYYGVYNRYVGNGNESSLSQVTVNNEAHEFNVYDSHRSMFLGTKKEYGYAFAIINGKAQFVKFNEVKKHPSIRYWLCGLYSEKVFAGQISGRYKGVNYDKMDFPVITRVNGVAGCGKSTKFKSLLQKYHYGTVVYATATSSSKQDLVGKIKFFTPKQKRVAVRTIGSILLNGIDVSGVKLLCVDESNMNHLGAIVLCAVENNIPYVLCMGDVQQLPYIERDSFNTSNYDILPDVSTLIANLNITHRLPMIICHLWRKEYACTGGLKTTSEIFGKLKIYSNPAGGSNGPIGYKEYSEIKSVINATVKNGETYLVLCNKQSEKADLKAYLKIKNGEIMTSHESEGRTVDHVFMVRTNTYAKEIMYSQSKLTYLLIATTRVRKSFTYFLPLLMNDDYVTFLRANMRVPEPYLKKHYYTKENQEFSLPRQIDDKLSIVDTNYGNGLFYGGGCPKHRGFQSKVSNPVTIPLLRGAGFVNSIKAIIHKSGEDEEEPGYTVPSSIFADIDVYKSDPNEYLFNTEELDTIINHKYGNSTSDVQIEFAGPYKVRRDHPKAAQLYANLGLEENHYLVPITRQVMTTIGNIPWKPVHRNTSVDSPVSVIQNWYDIAKPGASTIDLRNDSEIVFHSDLHLTAPKLSVNPGKWHVRDKSHGTLSPVIRTDMPPVRPDNFVEILLALLKRNLNSPTISQPVDEARVAKYLAESFVKEYICDSKKPELREMFNSKLAPNMSLYSEWSKTQPAKIDNSLDPEFDLLTCKPEVHELMIKNKPKPDLLPDANMRYSSLQTIATQKKSIIAVMCPVFKEVTSRLVSLLKDNVVFFTSMSPADLEQKFNDIRLAELLERYKGVEVDFSKFDKSQGRMAFLVEREIWRILGVDEDFLQFWWETNEYSRLMDYKHGTSANVNFQRKSGAGDTLMGNTIYGSSVLSVFKPAKIFSVFIGDDSFFLTDEDVVDMSDYCADTTNLEAKFNSYKYPSFCSKFILNMGGYVKIVPDPLKIITKLGRSDLLNDEHVECYRVSLRDLIEPLNDANIDSVLEAAIYERYGIEIGVSAVLDALITVTSSKERFRQLYYAAEGVIIKDNLVLPKED